MLGFARHAGIPEACHPMIRRTSALSMAYEATEAVAQAQREAYFAMMPSKAPPPIASVNQPPTAAPPTPSRTSRPHHSHHQHHPHHPHHPRSPTPPAPPLALALTCEPWRSRGSRACAAPAAAEISLSAVTSLDISPTPPRDLTLQHHNAKALPTVSLDLRAWADKSQDAVAAGVLAG